MNEIVQIKLARIKDQDGVYVQVHLGTPHALDGIIAEISAGLALQRRIATNDLKALLMVITGVQNLSHFSAVWTRIVQEDRGLRHFIRGLKSGEMVCSDRNSNPVDRLAIVDAGTVRIAAAKQISRRWSWLFWRKART
jgi:hypothetical protein